MKQIAAPFCVALAAAFFGIALYISIAEQPARLVLEAGAALAQWQTSFAVGIALQGSLTVIAGIAGLAAWWLLRDWRFGLGGMLMLANWPWTLVMIAPINTALGAILPASAGPQSQQLIADWGAVHNGRVALSLLALLLYLWAASQTARAAAA